MEGLFLFSILLKTETVSRGTKMLLHFLKEA